MAGNPCPWHPDALPMQVTLNGRQGCIPCWSSPRNLDERVPDDGIEVDQGQTRCPACRDVLQVRALPNGRCIVVGWDGSVHRHPWMEPGVLDDTARRLIHHLFDLPDTTTPRKAATPRTIEVLRLE